MKFEFNTGRLYTKEGQIIRVEIADGRCWFYDESRGIAGSIEWNRYDGPSQREVQEIVMQAYDHGNTRYEGMPNRGDFARRT